MVPMAHSIELSKRFGHPTEPFIMQGYDHQTILNTNPVRLSLHHPSSIHSRSFQLLYARLIKFLRFETHVPGVKRIRDQPRHAVPATLPASVTEPVIVEQPVDPKQLRPEWPHCAADDSGSSVEADKSRVRLSYLWKIFTSSSFRRRSPTPTPTLPRQ